MACGVDAFLNGELRIESEDGRPKTEALPSDRRGINGVILNAN